jgi:hypothetical protein
MKCVNLLVRIEVDEPIPPSVIDRLFEQYGAEVLVHQYSDEYAYIVQFPVSDVQLPFQFYVNQLMSVEDNEMISREA